MDSLSASVGVGKLIQEIGKDKYQDEVVSGGARMHFEGGKSYGGSADAQGNLVSHGGHVVFNFINRDSEAADNSSVPRDLELERISRQVVQEIEDSELFVSILHEVQSLFNISSDGYPPSVKAALGSCISHQEIVKQCKEQLVAAEAHGEGKAIIKEYQKSFLEASKAFGQSVLLFRQLVYGSIHTNINVIYKGKHSKIITNTQVQQDFTKAVRPSVGPEVKKFTRKWSIMFCTGLEKERGTRWPACRAITDTACDGNWIRHDILVKAGLEDHIQDFEGDPINPKDADGKEHKADKFIMLWWYLNNEVEIRSDRFFVAPRIPVPMIFGKEFINEKWNELFPEKSDRESLEQMDEAEDEDKDENEDEDNEDEDENQDENEDEDEGDDKDQEQPTILPFITRLKRRNKAKKAADKKKEADRRIAEAQAEEKRSQEAAIALAARFIPPVQATSAIEAQNPNVSNVTASPAADTISIATVSTATTEISSGWSTAANASTRTLSSTESAASSVVDVPGTVTPTDKIGMRASIEPVNAASEQA